MRVDRCVAVNEIKDVIIDVYYL